MLEPVAVDARTALDIEPADETWYYRWRRP
jgi:hypothetical protein